MFAFPFLLMDTAENLANSCVEKFKYIYAYSKYIFTSSLPPVVNVDFFCLISLKIVRFENCGRISMGCTSYLITLQCPLVAKNYFAMSFQKTDPLKVMKLKRK